MLPVEGLPGGELSCGFSDEDEPGVAAVALRLEPLLLQKLYNLK